MRRKWISPSYTIINTPEMFRWVITELSGVEIFAFDIETNGLNPRKDHIVGFSIVFRNYDDDLRGFYFPLRHIKKPAHTKFGFSLLVNDEELCSQLNPDLAMKFLSELFTPGRPELPLTSDKLLIGHNIKFDLSFLKSQNVIPKIKLFDTLVAEGLIDSRRISEGKRSSDGLSLKRVIVDYVEVESVKKWKDFGDSLDQVSITDVAEYCINDSAYTYMLFEEQKKIIDKEFKKLFYDIEMPLIPVLVNMEAGGVRINEDHLKKINKKVKLRLDELDENFAKIIDKRVNLNSPVQLKEFIYDYLKMPEIKKRVRRKTGNVEILATDSDSIELLLSEIKDKKTKEYKSLSIISEYLQLSSLNSTHIEGLMKRIENGKIHTDYDSMGSRSGRFSSRPNLQNPPVRTDFDVRKAFIPDQQKIFVVADWSGMQLRIAAAISRDRKMLLAFKQNEDLHQKTAKTIFDIPIPTKNQRYQGKTVNFSILFGATGYGVSAQLKCPVKKGKKIVEDFYTLYGGFYKWKQKTELEVERDGFTLTPLGRKRRYNFDTMYPKYEMRSVINSKIQGTEADILKLSLIKLNLLLKAKPEWGTRIVLHIHDEIVVECFPGFINEVKKCLIKSMQVKLKGVLLPIEISVKTDLSKEETENL